MSQKLPTTFVKGFHHEELVRRMEYRALGKTGMNISVISFGCGTLSDFYGDLDLKEALETIKQAIKSGINYIDTAPFYGNGRSEEVLGMALKDVPREAYYMATKVGRYNKDYSQMFDYTAKTTRESVNKSLKLLGLDYIDVIQIHDVEFAQDFDTIVNECLPELQKFVEEGKVKFIGLTGYALSALEKCLEAAPGKFQTVLSYARNTLLDNSLKEYMAYFQKQQLGIICASGHALGLLTNAGPQPWHPAPESIKQLCRQASEICKQANVELGKLAMYEFIKFPGVTTFLTGMQTRHLLNMNLDVYYNGLNTNEQEILENLKNNVFNKSLHWENYELEKINAILKESGGGQQHN